jgi:multidrug efflux pump subunit AcrB
MNNENIATKMGLLFLFYFSYLSFGFLVLDSVSDYFFPSDDSTCCKCNVETCDNPNLDRTNIDRADVTTMRNIDPVSHAVSRAFFMALFMTPAMYYYRRKKEKEQNQFKQ